MRLAVPRRGTGPGESKALNVLAFDIETVPDVEAGAAVHQLEGLDEEGVGKALLALRRQETGNDFLPLHLHRIVAIAVVLRSGDQLHIRSVGDAEATEAELLARFFDGLERYRPTLVTWNGGGFDLPVIQYRCMVHGVVAADYWRSDEDFRFNNYRNRYHERHTDLMDVLSGFQVRAAARLDSLAATLGLPGKIGMHGAEVWREHLAGNLDGIRSYCEVDALNTYMLYLRFEHIRGHLSARGFAEESQRVRDLLVASEANHWRDFLSQWRTKEEWCAAPKGSGGA